MTTKRQTCTRATFGEVSKACARQKSGTFRECVAETFPEKVRESCSADRLFASVESAAERRTRDLPVAPAHVEGPILTLPDFDYGTQPKVSNSAKIVATAKLPDGTIVDVRKSHHRTGPVWITASFQGMRASNTLQTKNPEKVAQWVDAVRRGAVAIVKGKDRETVFERNDRLHGHYARFK